MAKNLAKTISRIAERTSNLVYVVDLDNRIVFANQAIADWGDWKIDQLLGRSLSSEAAVANGWAGLAPPEELLAWTRPPVPTGANESRRLFWVWKAMPQLDQPTVFCPATAQILFEDGQPASILIIGQPDLETNNLPQAVDGAMDVRAVLAQTRNESRSWFTVESLVGSSPAAGRIRQQMAIARQVKTNVLFTGPPGSGKEHLARTLFEACHDDDRPTLTPIHCSIADPQLIQQAVADAKEFDRQNENQEISLLLLDVDQLSADAQAELNGFLAMPGFAVQTLATAGDSLWSSGNGESFSSELAFRLSSLVIQTQPLCDRREDIPVLAQAFLEQFNRRSTSRSGKRAHFSEQANECLSEFDWPRNINQLQQVVQLAAENCNETVITEKNLPTDFLQAVTAMRIGRPEDIHIDLDQYLASIEKELVIRALRQAKGNKTQAAKQLNVSRPKLLRRLQFFQLSEFLSPSGSSESETIDSSAFEELSE